MEYRACKEKQDVILTLTSEVIQQAVTSGKVGAWDLSRLLDKDGSSGGLPQQGLARDYQEGAETGWNRQWLREGGICRWILKRTACMSWLRKEINCTASTGGASGMSLQEEIVREADGKAARVTERRKRAGWEPAGQLGGLGRRQTGEEMWFPRGNQTKQNVAAHNKNVTYCNITYHVVDTGGVPWLRNISANFLKFRNDPCVIFRGLGEDDAWKKSEAKNLVTLSKKKIQKNHSFVVCLHSTINFSWFT